MSDLAIAIAAIATLLGGCIGALWRGGRTEGRIMTVLEGLQKITEDHEQRIRLAERRRW